MNKIFMKTVCRNIIFILLMTSHLSLAKADDAEHKAQENQRPRWGVDIKTGRFTPDLERWSEFYGEDDTKQLAASLSYKFFRSFEVGGELAYIKDEGVGRYPLSDVTGGSVEHQLYPLHVFAVYRAIFNEDQFFVPYLGLGYTRTYYRQKIAAQPTSSGEVGGQHVRAGLQILLDGIDPGGSAAMESDHSVSNSYITVEVQEFSAEVDEIELGGKSIMVGFMFEF